MPLALVGCLSGAAKLEPEALDTVEPAPKSEPAPTVPIPERDAPPPTARQPGKCPAGSSAAEVGKGRVTAKIEACDGPKICKTDENGCEICRCREHVDRDAPERQVPALDPD